MCCGCALLSRPCPPPFCLPVAYLPHTYRPTPRLPCPSPGCGPAPTPPTPTPCSKYWVKRKSLDSNLLCLGPALIWLPACSKYWVNRKPRASAKASYNLASQQRLWELLQEQTGAQFNLP